MPCDMLLLYLYRLQMTYSNLCACVSIKQMRHNKHAPCLLFQTVKHVLRFQYKIPFLFRRLLLELKAKLLTVYQKQEKGSKTDKS